ncbi:MAG: hypothetical protein GXY74_16400 [Phycisphaerae bacterium]|nr:hypothetical protein [Phycisphaerae bacterium]
MADLLEQSSAWLDGQRKKFLAKTVTYCRGQAEVSCPATVGRTTFEVEDSTGVVERFESRDFIITAADLVLDGVVALPERGDRIRETVGEATLVYEVVSPGQEPCWRWSDPYRLALRIHTKQVGTA